MKKLVQGIVAFRKNMMPGYREKFAHLALGQSPDALFIACSDSRVAPNVFASTDPGDVFVIRNVGNLIPPCGLDGVSMADESEAAAIEFSLLTLKVSNIIVCGHSDCGAMQALIQGREKVLAPNLRSWLRHGEGSSAQKLQGADALPFSSKLSQQNVLQQLDHLRSYPIITERIQQGRLKLHGWWFDLHSADVYAFEEPLNRFVIIDEAEADRILSKLSR